MTWFRRMASPKIRGADKKASVPTGLWRRCERCGQTVLAEEMAQSLEVCASCGFHHRLDARSRLAAFADEGSLVEVDAELAPEDPLGFVDTSPYPERVERARAKSHEREAFVLVEARLYGRPLVAGAFVFDFLGGSMGSVVGEKVTRAFELGAERGRPVVLFSASGGARMQEGALSLMQMAKTTVALSRFREARQPFVSVLTDPTTGGVAASFALLGDVIIAEPDALVGFAGPRVIEQTIRQTLPEGFQRSEFLLAHGVIDLIVPRAELRDRIAKLLAMLAP